MDELARLAARLAERLGPQTYDMVIEATRVGVWSNIAGSIMWGIGLQIPLAGVCLAYRIVRRNMGDKWDKDEDGFVFFIAFAIAGLISIIGVLVLLWLVVDPWTWTAVRHPELWLTHRLLKI